MFSTDMVHPLPASSHHPLMQPWTGNIKKLRSCFNYRRVEWTKESLLKAPLISNYKLKRIFWLKRTAKFNINSKSTTRLICNSYLEISIARDLGGLAFISAIKTSRPFKLNIIFHPAWKKWVREPIWIHKKHNFDTKEQWHCRKN